jgi:hypothetical protein
MQQIQDELQTDHPTVPIQILGLNEAGYEEGNAQMCDGRDLPWLQDVPDVDVWDELWNVTYRDVWILDDENVPFAVFNVTAHDLSNPVEYAALKALLLEAAGLVE